MALLEATLLMTIVSAIECQIRFPTSRPIISEQVTGGSCVASNGQAGSCYEFRSTQFQQCSFFPSHDSNNPNVAQHLRNNICSTGRAVYFCCPNNISGPTPPGPPPPPPPPIPTVVTPGMKECAMPCDGSSQGCLRPDVIPCEDECGQTNSDNVVGGEVSARGAWPWLAAIGRKDGADFRPFCGGTLITKQHVITAAHCFKTQKPFIVTVRLGEYNTDEVSAIDGALDFDIVDMRVGDYNQNTNENDIILLKLDRPLNAYTGNIRPACLPYHLREKTFEGDMPIVVGWGVFDIENPRVSIVPLQTPVPVVPIPECQQRYRNGGDKIDNRQICAGTGVQDSCNGDSGGPLNYIDLQRFRFYLIGLVSFGPRNCGSHNLPGVYLRIGHYLDWIDQNIKQLL